VEQPTRTNRSLLGWVEERVSLTEIVSFLSVFGLLPTELDTTKPLREALAESLRRPLPSYARWPHVLGIVSFVLFLILGVTGALLAFYYQPTAAEAYHSATAIARDVSMGALVAQVHHWASILFLAVLALRIVRFYFGALYGHGREIVWMVAIVTFVVAAVADLSGRLLPWDARGYWTMVRAREVTDALPGVGAVSTFLVGGAGLDSLILTRFYVLHMLVLPGALLLLFYVHFSSVRRVGLSHVVADPLSTPPNARPPWYLLAPHAVQQALPGALPMVVRGLFIEALFALILLLPFLDRSDATGPRRRLFLGLGAAACAGWAALTWLGWVLEVHR